MKPLACLFAVSLVLAGACARVNETRSDGQTHWMRRCSASDDCGALACICGVCTEACSAQDACALEGDGTGVCATADGTLDTDACDGDPSEVRACVPACDGPSDCGAIEGGLACSGDGVCALAERVVPGEDAGEVEPPCVPSTELCNGIDDDCDGIADPEDSDAAEACDGIVVNAVAACVFNGVSMVCARISCDDGFQSCDGDPANGCEHRGETCDCPTC